MPYGHASMLLLGEGSEATEPYKYEPLQINQVPRILAVTALILFRFENRLFCLVLKSAVLSRIHGNRAWFPVIAKMKKKRFTKLFRWVFGHKQSYEVQVKNNLFCRTANK